MSVFYRLTTVSLLLAVFLAGCNAPAGPGTVGLKITPTQEAVSTKTPLPTFTAAPTGTATLTPTQTNTATPTATATYTPTTVPTDTPTVTPTNELPSATVKMQANCRYGPASAYLYYFGLYPGDNAIVGGRNYSGTWLRIKPEKLGHYCWAAKSVLAVEEGRDVMRLPVVSWPLPHEADYPPPSNIQATRAGDQVTITWDKITMTQDKDRGYLIEANVCQGGYLVFVVANPWVPTYTINDQSGCKEKSNGKLYLVDKHGYSDPVDIPWP